MNNACTQSFSFSSFSFSSSFSVEKCIINRINKSLRWKKGPCTNRDERNWVSHSVESILGWVWIAAQRSAAQRSAAHRIGQCLVLPEGGPCFYEWREAWNDKYSRHYTPPRCMHTRRLPAKEIMTTITHKEIVNGRNEWIALLGSPPATKVVQKNPASIFTFEALIGL